MLGYLVTWLSYQLIAKPRYKTATPPWPIPCTFSVISQQRCGAWNWILLVEGKDPFIPISQYHPWPGDAMNSSTSSHSIDLGPILGNEPGIYSGIESRNTFLVHHQKCLPFVWNIFMKSWHLNKFPHTRLPEFLFCVLPKNDVCVSVIPWEGAWWSVYTRSAVKLSVHSVLRHHHRFHGIPNYNAKWPNLISKLWKSIFYVNSNRIWLLLAQPKFGNMCSGK